MGRLRVLRIGANATVQDLGRPGYLAVGLSRGGAADRLAILEGAAILGNDLGCAAIELPMGSARFQATEPCQIAVTGADVTVDIDGANVAGYQSLFLNKNHILTVGSARAGVYAYLHVGGGIRSREWMGSRSAHLAARIGAAIAEGDILPVRPKSGSTSPAIKLAPAPRLAGGMVRLLRTAQTGYFSDETCQRFVATTFLRSARGNRQGVLLECDREKFTASNQLSLASEVVQPGDIQLTGDGVPYILGPECQTTGGYPRIATVHPDDLPIVAQTAPGAALRFHFVDVEPIRQQLRDPAIQLKELASRLEPALRDPREMSDLLGYQLISGVEEPGGGEEP